MKWPKAAYFILVLTCLIPILSPLLCQAEDEDKGDNGTSEKTLKGTKPADRNSHIYYKNKLEISLDSGYLPNNIPFIFDFLTGDPYLQPLLDYTLVPFMPTLRWQIGNPRGPSFLRGNTEFSASTSFIMIPRGPETRYWDFLLGIRRNFVYRNWRVAPYLEGRLGAGFINAKGPYGVLYAQGQDFTFTVMLDGGARYNLNSRYSVEAGLGYIHISNLYLSLPKVPNFGINVYGPMVGFDMRLGKEH